MQDSSNVRQLEGPFFDKAYEKYVRRFSGENPNYEAIDYLLDLGLSWRSLTKKNVLDLGADDANFAIAAKKRGIHVESLDLTPPSSSRLNGVPFTVGNINSLPYPNESFDFVIARATMGPKVFETKSQLIHLLDEVKRVLRKEGEFRFGPGPVEINELTEAEQQQYLALIIKTYREGLEPKEKKLMEDLEHRYTVQDHIEKKREARSRLSLTKQGSLLRKESLGILHSVDPNITIHSGARWRGPKQNFYFAMPK